jgi:hypothetical protein
MRAPSVDGLLEVAPAHDAGLGQAAALLAPPSRLAEALAPVGVVAPEPWRRSRALLLLLRIFSLNSSAFLGFFRSCIPRHEPE